ncbi:SUKH-3 immunity protein [Streptomyces sp. 2231.1]|nr:SUKH-3 immunity protein [Streptomyces sp. 2231.1]
MLPDIVDQALGLVGVDWPNVDEDACCRSSASRPFDQKGMRIVPVLKSPEAVDVWLSNAGWYPGRRCDDLAASEVASVLKDFRDDGGSLDVITPALEFLREHIGLVAPRHASTEDRVEFYPRLMYRGAAEDVQELADGLGKKVFPVAHDTYDGGTVLMDEDGRFFYLHHSGEYFLGNDKYSAFMSYSRGYPLEQAEDYYA